MLYLTSRGCWYAALTVFTVLLLLLLIFTPLNYGYVYAISFGAFLFTLFTTAAHAVYVLDRARTPTLRPR